MEHFNFFSTSALEQLVVLKQAEIENIKAILEERQERRKLSSEAKMLATDEEMRRRQDNEIRRLKDEIVAVKAKGEKYRQRAQNIQNMREARAIHTHEYIQRELRKMKRQI